MSHTDPRQGGPANPEPTDIDESLPLTRRQAIVGLAGMLGASLAGAELPSELPLQATGADKPVPRALSPHQYKVLECIADTLLPATETPGALSAGVPQTIDLLLAEWALPEKRKRYLASIDAVDESAQRSHGNDFVLCTGEARLEVLGRIDTAAFAGEDPFHFRGLKKLIVFAFFSSQIGATSVLAFDPVPGGYRACDDSTSPDRAWFIPGFAYEL